MDNSLIYNTVRLGTFRRILTNLPGFLKDANSPGSYSDRLEEARRVIQKLRHADVTFSFVGQSLDLGLTDQRLIQLAWDLDAVEKHYASLWKKFSRLRLQTDEDVFLAHIELVTAWQKLPFIDPGLPCPPAPLLPPQGTDHRVAADLASFLTQWRSTAQHHWNEIAATAPAR